MICAAIDIGSNTIRLSVYRCDEGEIHLLLNKKTMAGLAGYVRKDRLSPRGIDRACEVLSEYRQIIDHFPIDRVFVFATASLRNVANTDEAVAAIEAATGFEVEILTGSREAFLDFIGAAHFTRLSSGVLVDIGGGSTEIVTFTAGEADRALSIPIGSLKLYTAYVESVLPDKAERKKIRQRVMAELDGLSGFSQQTFALMVGVGGSIRAAGKLYQDETGLPFTERIPVAALQKLLGKVEKADRATLRRLLQVMPDRVHTFIPGMILLETIASYFQVKELTISPYGVREGYVYDRMSRETRKG